MQTVQLAPTDGLLHAPAGTPCGEVVERGTTINTHVGTTLVLDGSLAQAWARHEPWLLRQVVRVVMDGPGGRLQPALAPRAAVGPDFTMLGPPWRPVEFTLKLEHVALWVQSPLLALDDTLRTMQQLLTRGVTLAQATPHDGTSFTVTAALPRPGLAPSGWTRLDGPAWPRAQPAPMHLERWEDAAEPVVRCAWDSHLCMRDGPPPVADLPADVATMLGLGVGHV